MRWHGNRSHGRIEGGGESRGALAEISSFGRQSSEIAHEWFPAAQFEIQRNANAMQRVIALCKNRCERGPVLSNKLSRLRLSLAITQKRPYVITSKPAIHGFFRTFGEPWLALCRRGKGRYKEVKLWRLRAVGYGTADVVAGCRRSRSGSVAGLRAGPARDGAASRSEGKLLPSVPADFAAHA